ncbi:prepilin peptidase [Roseovarius aestuariivivens]|uniref:prepilin peptidase n=1 Tax=Roseovarius aestuariivivens TaxID=1888910 RepID=UPI0010814CDE|nr:A24 family peptidase [Roseovarius aestuariivivens]
MTVTFADLLLIVISPAIGSFLGVLADRLPRQEDIVRRPSACRSCGRRLGFFDLVPILSFVLAQGRCRSCGAAIPPWLIYAEILATGLAVIAVILGQQLADTWLTALFLWLLLTLVITDLLWFRLPDALTLPLIATALALSLITGQPPLTDALLGALIGSGVFIILRVGYRVIRRREGLGLGDIKLMAGLGAAIGSWNLPAMLLTASLAALAVAAAGRLRSRNALRASRPLPFGAALAAATAMQWVLLQLPA